MLPNWCNAACRNLVEGALMGRYARSGRINSFRRPHSSYACPACKLRVLPSCVVGSFVFLVRALVVSGAIEADEGGVAAWPRPLAFVRNGSARVHRLVGDLTLTHVDELANDAG